MRADALVAQCKRFLYDARPDLAGNLTTAGKYELGQVLAAVSGLANRDSPRFFYLWGECSLLGAFALPCIFAWTFLTRGMTEDNIRSMLRCNATH